MFEIVGKSQIAEPAFTCAAAQNFRRLFQGPMHLINRPWRFSCSLSQQWHVYLQPGSDCMPARLSVCLPHSIFINHSESTVQFLFSKTDFYGHVTCFGLTATPNANAIDILELQNWWCDPLLHRQQAKPLSIGKVNKKFAIKLSEAWHYLAELNEPYKLEHEAVKWFNDIRDWFEDPPQRKRQSIKSHVAELNML